MYGNLDVAKESVKAVVEAATSGRYNGYPSSIGKTLGLPNMNNIYSSVYIVKYSSMIWFKAV